MKIIPNTHIPRIGLTFKYLPPSHYCKIVGEEICNNKKCWRYEHGGYDFQYTVMDNILNGKIVVVTKREYELNKVRII